MADGAARELVYEPVPADDAVFRLQQRIHALEQRVAALEGEVREQGQALLTLTRLLRQLEAAVTLAERQSER